MTSADIIMFTSLFCQCFVHAEIIFISQVLSNELYSIACHECDVYLALSRHVDQFVVHKSHMNSDSVLGNVALKSGQTNTTIYTTGHPYPLQPSPLIHYYGTSLSITTF